MALRSQGRCPIRSENWTGSEGQLGQVAKWGAEGGADKGIACAKAWSHGWGEFEEKNDLCGWNIYRWVRGLWGKNEANEEIGSDERPASYVKELTSEAQSLKTIQFYVWTFEHLMIKK